MKNPTFLVETTTLLTIDITSLSDQIEAENFANLCKLRWKLKKLFVCSSNKDNIILQANKNFGWSVNCVRKSNVNAVCADIKIGSSALMIWANICKSANKPFYIRTTSLKSLPHNIKPTSWFMKRLLDRFLAFLLIIFLSPIFLGIMFISFFAARSSVISSDFCIGERGKIFKLYSFKNFPHFYNNSKRISEADKNLINKIGVSCVINLSSFLEHYKIDRLPHLFNVLAGHLSLVGPYPCKLSEIDLLTCDTIKYIRMMPGLSNLYLRDFCRSHSKQNLNISLSDRYINTWSLWFDIKTIILRLLNL